MSEWFEEAKNYLLSTYDRLPVHFVRGEGVYLYDEDNTRYIDALAGIAVNVLGYRHPRFLDRAESAVEEILHVSNLFQIEHQFKLARDLADMGFDGAGFFCNSGAEANEAAIKFARKYADRHDPSGKTIVSCTGSFHGRTLGALTATGQTKYQKGFEPLPDGFEYVDFNDSGSLSDQIDDSTAGVLIEPIQGEGGVRPATDSFLRSIRELCDEHNALMIVDEVQTGIGRTGEFYAINHSEVTPDIICMAKGLGGGFPIGGIMVRDSLREKGLQSGDHASTFGGNPFVTAMARAVIDIIRQESLLQNASERGSQLKTLLKELSNRYKFLGEPRGKGLMIGVPVNDPVDAGDIMTACLESGLVIGTAGENALRFVPPLILSETETEELIERLDNALRDF
ncbi:MAG: aspartate aminotransferase family protein [bacterium]